MKFRKFIVGELVLCLFAFNVSSTPCDDIFYEPGAEFHLLKMDPEQSLAVIREVIRRKLYVDVLSPQGFEHTYRFFALLPGRKIQVTAKDESGPYLSLVRIDKLRIRIEDSREHQPALMPVDLAQEIALSEIPSPFLEIMRQSGARLLDVYSYLDQATQFYDSISLGLDILMSDILQAVGGLESFHESYQDLDLVGDLTLTQKFMHQVFVEQSRPVVFLVPRHLRQGVTYEELLWLVQRPQFLERVTFVFGGYNFIPTHVRQEAGIGLWELLKNYRRHILRP